MRSILNCVLLLALACLALADPAQTITGLDETGRAVRLDPVTEEEWAARQPPSTGTQVCRTEAELVAAVVAGGDIWVPGPVLTLSAPLTPRKRASIRGPGAGLAMLTMGQASTGDRLVHPQAPDITISGLALSGGPRRVTAVYLDGFSRGADRLTLDGVLILSCKSGVRLTGGPARNPDDILEDLTIRHCRIIDWTEGGVWLAWELLRPRIESSHIMGLGPRSSFNAVWLGLGVVDAHVAQCTLGGTSRMGGEFFYAAASPTVPGQPGPALVSQLHPQGPSITFADNTINDTGSFGVSFAGCKRSTLSHFHVRNATGIGAEFVDEDAGRSHYAASDFSVTNTAGTAISIDKIKGGRFDNIFVDGVRPLTGSEQRGVSIYQSDDVTFNGSTLTGAGPRYLAAIHSTRVNVTDNLFIAETGETFPIGPEGGNFALYSYLSDVFFSRNIIRGTLSNPLRTCLNGGTVTTSATGQPMSGYNPAFTDPDNFRSKR